MRVLGVFCLLSFVSMNNRKNCRPIEHATDLIIGLIFCGFWFVLLVIVLGSDVVCILYKVKHEILVQTDAAFLLDCGGLKI